MMVRYSVTENSIRNVKSNDDVTETRYVIGVKTNGELVHNAADNIKIYCALIERVEYSDDKVINRYYIKGNSAALFYNPHHNVYGQHTEWNWKKVEPAVMDLYAKFLNTKSEKYILLAQRRYLNGEKG